MASEIFFPNRAAALPTPDVQVPQQDSFFVSAFDGLLNAATDLADKFTTVERTRNVLEGVADNFENMGLFQEAENYRTQARTTTINAFSKDDQFVKQLEAAATDDLIKTSRALRDFGQDMALQDQAITGRMDTGLALEEARSGNAMQRLQAQGDIWMNRDAARAGLQEQRNRRLFEFDQQEDEENQERYLERIEKSGEEARKTKQVPTASQSQGKEVPLSPVINASKNYLRNEASVDDKRTLFDHIIRGIDNKIDKQFFIDETWDPETKGFATSTGGGRTMNILVEELSQKIATGAINPLAPITVNWKNAKGQRVLQKEGATSDIPGLGSQSMSTSGPDSTLLTPPQQAPPISPTAEQYADPAVRGALDRLSKNL